MAEASTASRARPRGAKLIRPIVPVSVQLASMFTTHGRLEDEFITPMLTELHPELAAESADEHERAKRLLAKIEALPAGLARRHLIAELGEVVKAHRILQDASVFPLLIEKLDVGELESLGRRMRAAEQRLRQTSADTTGAAETARPARPRRP